MVETDSLFGTDLQVPQIVMRGDSARTRRKDPIQSHMAGDVSQRNRAGCAVGVLTIVASGDHFGSEINELYRQMREDYDWPKAAWDSPRKRAGELCEDGYFEESEISQDGKRAERVFHITPKGLAFLKELR